MASFTVYLSVGSNIGEKLDNCQRGIRALARFSTITGQSPFYRTEPVDYRDQDWFVNAVVRIETELLPEALLAELKRIQKKSGRKKETIRFGPRTLDLDILLINDLVLETPELVVPHPRMNQRRFVLKPMCDIDSDIIHPVLNETIANLLARLDENGQALGRL